MVGNVTDLQHRQLREAHPQIKKQTTGPTLEHNEEEQLISLRKTPQQHGKRYVVSGMEASKSGCGSVIKGADREKRFYCRHGCGNYWSMRAHECARSDPLQKSESRNVLNCTGSQVHRDSQSSYHNTE